MKSEISLIFKLELGISFVFKVFLIFNRVLISSLFKIVEGIKIRIRDVIDFLGFLIFNMFLISNLYKVAPGAGDRR